ncbi:MAG TPA: multicopper oxidase domain-containing protein, partial [Ginsengibacter sp.]|nr:multicopper oxidase domain-containing protein [Ginsengibacter sp.]
PRTTGQIMAFRVSKPLDTNIPLSVLPARLLPSITPLVQNGPVRKLLLAEGEDRFERIEPILGTVDGGAMDFDEPVTENIKLNDTEIWEFYNTTVDEHPIHLHLVKFQVISHQKFTGDLDPVTKKLTNIRLTGQPQLYNLDEKGWKDTHIVPAGEVTRVIAKFDRAGKYVWHCHILSHEDHDMMRPFIVSETGDASALAKATAGAKIDAANQLRLTILPNPFSSDVTINLNLPEAKKVSIKLYDQKGSLVKQIYSGNREAGFQKWTIDGSNMVNGIYFCEVMVNNSKFLRKLVLQK